MGTTEASNHDILVCGSVYIPDSSVARGWIVRLDKDGNKKWSHIVGLYPGDGFHEYLHNIIELKDGSIIVSGSSAGLDSQGRWTQDGWLFRVDSNGCLSPGCNNLGISDNNRETKSNVTIYPNPANDYVTITSTLPFSKATAVSLLDNSGKTIKYFPTPAGKQKIIYSLKGISSGVYYFNFTTRNETRKEKIIIVK